MRIALVIDSLRSGGAEKVASTLVNHWTESGNQSTLVTLASADTDFYGIDVRVNRIALGLNRSSRNWREFVRNNSQRIRMLRGVVRSLEFDVLVSFVDKTNVMVLLATLGLGVPVVVSERTDPRKHQIGKVARYLRFLLYPRARAVVVQTAGVAEWARHIVGSEAVHVIPNPVAEQFSSTWNPNRRESGHNVVAMGRMGPEKGFDLLLRAFARCAERHPEWSLRVVGDGTERERLRTLAYDLGIERKVRLCPVTKEPEKALRESDIFVLPSRYEGFPNVLLEAMACGLPVISFDCPSGPREIIRDGIDGILVPAEDIEALASAIERLMETEEERRRLAARAIEVRERFEISRVLGMWMSVLDEAAGRGIANKQSDTLAGE